MRTRLVVITILCFCFVILAQHTNAASDIADLAWIAGNWTGVQDGLEMEESWLPPKGNTMLGLHRDVKNNRTISFEFLRIEATADGITYWGSPHGKPAVPFRLIELSGKKATFENTKHDFPQRIIYWLGSDDMLHAKIEGIYKGESSSEEWSWRRAEK